MLIGTSIQLGHTVVVKSGPPINPTPNPNSPIHPSRDRPKGRRLPRTRDSIGATHQLPASILPLPRPSTRPRAWILFQQRAAVPWSFTDRTRKIVIDDLGIKTVLALDGHFRHGGLDVQG